MTEFKAVDFTALGDCYLRLAQVVGDYRLVNRVTLTESENQRIKDLHWRLLNYADDFFTEASITLVHDIQDSIDAVVSITSEIKETTFKLVEVQNAINIATAGMAFAASVITRNPKAISDAVSQLQAALKASRKTKA